MRPLVVYHSNCIDGSTAALCAFNTFGDEADYLPAIHRKTEKKFDYLDTKDRDVYFLDFCFSREFMLKIRSVAKNITILDHHVTAMNDLRGMDFLGKFDMNKSGAMLSYEYFKPQYVNPELVKIVQDVDLYRHEIDYSKEIAALLFSLPSFDPSNKESVEIWKSYMIMNVVNLREPAYSHLRQREKEVKILVGRAHKTKMFNEDVWIANATNCVAEVATELAKRGKFGAAYYIDEEGSYVYSLRSYGDEDVSILAKRIGGGGHKNASAFSSKSPVHSGVESI